ncbi:MAG: molybdopterin-dependent oxidoreductase [Actinomycetes bacterium]
MSVTDTEREYTAYRTCPLCEATCGLELKMRGDQVVKVRGDENDVFSKGFICPKGASIGALHSDPDRLTVPMVKDGDGHREATWDEAFELAAEGLAPFLSGDRNVIGTYFGNPNAHNLSALLYNSVLIKSIGTKTRFSASSLDQLPKQVASGHMYGSSLGVAIPDIDRTDLMVIMGANPLASNGSMMTAPDFRGRIRAIRARGGRVVVIDPARTRTAKEADLHLPIRPGTDVFLLFALLNVLLNEGFVSKGLEKMGEKASLLNGVDEICAEAEHFAPETVAPKCGITAEEIRTLARDLGNADRASVYGRIGTCTQEFGTTASWLIDVLNIVTGNLDREGGVMFPDPAAGGLAGEPGKGRGIPTGRWGTRVRGLEESLGELPTAALAEEIDTPGEGQIRVMITSGGNPILSAPNGDRLEKAFAGLDFMISIDPYLNETTRHANVIFPSPSPLAKSHYDLAFYQLSIRNIANFSPAVVDLPEGFLDEWETLLKLAMIFAGQPADSDITGLDDFVAMEVAKSELARHNSAAAGMTPEEVVSQVSDRRGPERLLDILLRCGPHGDGFGLKPGGLSVDRLITEEHGVDLGALAPRLPGFLRTPSGMVEVAPPQFMADVPRVIAALNRIDDGFVLVGRRHLRSNNSWMHNIEPLVKGPARCTLQINPIDAGALGIEAGGNIKVTSKAGDLTAPVEITDDILPGVVSLPHGWGHGLSGTRSDVANSHAGVNSNILTDEGVVDQVSGNAVLNGIPVELAPA